MVYKGNKMNWISVKEKSFPKKDSFLLSKNDRVYFATYDKEGEFYVVASSLDYGCLDLTYNANELVGEFTFWMPLPEPAQEIK